MIYEQSLIKTIPDYIQESTIKSKNKNNKWDYGYNADHDIIVISKSGKIGEIVEIQNLKIALPLAENVYKKSEIKSEQYWEQFEYPKDLSKIKEQLGETREIDVKNTNLVLSSLNIDLDNLLDDIDPLNSTPDNLNPPPCS